MDVRPIGSSYSLSRIRITRQGGGVFAAANTYQWTIRARSRGGVNDIAIAKAGDGTAVMEITIGVPADGADVSISTSGAIFGLVYRGFYVTATGPAAVDGTQLTITVSHKQWCDAVAQLTVPDLEDNESIVDELRMLGCSILYTNDAAPQARAGRRAQVQVGGSVPEDNFFYPTAGPGKMFTGVSSQQNSDSSDLVEGAYSYRKVGSLTDFDMKAFEGSFENGSSGEIGYDPYPTSDYVVMVLSAPLPQAGALSTAQVGRVTFCSGVEYETEDTWRFAQPPPIDEEHFKAALKLMKNMDQHSGNKNHLAMLARGIWNALKPAARLALPAVGGVLGGPAGAGVGNALAGLLLQ